MGPSPAALKMTCHWWSALPSKSPPTDSVPGAASKAAVKPLYDGLGVPCMRNRSKTICGAFALKSSLTSVDIPLVCEVAMRLSVQDVVPLSKVACSITPFLMSGQGEGLSGPAQRHTLALAVAFDSVTRTVLG